MSWKAAAESIIKIARNKHAKYIEVVQDFVWVLLLLHYDGKGDYIRTLRGVWAVLLEHCKLFYLCVPLDVSPSVLLCLEKAERQQKAPAPASLPVTKTAHKSSFMNNLINKRIFIYCMFIQKTPQWHNVIM